MKYLIQGFMGYPKGYKLKLDNTLDIHVTSKTSYEQLTYVQSRSS